MKRVINPWEHEEGYYCFGCSKENQGGLKMEFYEEGDEIVSQWEPDLRFQGWINTLHGGIQAVLLDEICAWTILRKLQLTGVTSKMETRYLKSVSTNDSYLTLRSTIQEVKRNLVLVEARLYNSADELCTKAVCTYFTFSPQRSQEEMNFTSCEVEEIEL